MGWTDRGSYPGTGKRYSFLRIRPDRRRGPPSLLHNVERGPFPEAKQPEHVVDHPSPSITEVKNV